MAKQIDYPRANLKACLDLAHAVDELGGSCSVEMAADKLNKKVSGAFSALVGSTSKFGLISSKKGQLHISKLFKGYKLSYSEDEERNFLAEIFLQPPLFKRIHERFQNRKLPVEHFEKLLIREFDVPDAISSRVAKYFLDGAKQCGLLDQNHHLQLSLASQNDTNEEEIDIILDDLDQQLPETDEILTSDTFPQAPRPITNHYEEFSVRIYGPGMDSTIVVKEAEDLIIVQAMLKKVEKRIKEFENNDFDE